MNKKITTRHFSEENEETPLFACTLLADVGGLQGINTCILENIR